MKDIYMDYAATTYLKNEVLEEMMPYFKEYYANPSSIYRISKKTKKSIRESKEKIAKLINAEWDEIFFTSGGTESDNWALKGIAWANENKGKHIITSAIEHSAILKTCKYLEGKGFKITYIPVDKEGIIKIDELEKAINKETILVSIMFANNEIGSIQPIKEIGTICKNKGVYFHTDAVQAIGHIPVDVKNLNVDLLSMSSHKFYGPKGIGALYIKKGTNIHNLIHGGAQERGKRSGTENIAAIVGMTKALEICVTNMEEEVKKEMNLRDRLIEGLLTIPDSKLNGPLGERRLPSNVNVSFKNADGEAMLILLDQNRIYASAGSACSSGALEYSHVIKSIGLRDEFSKGTIRFSLGDKTTKEEIEKIIKDMPNIVEKSRVFI